MIEINFQFLFSLLLLSNAFLLINCSCFFWTNKNDLVSDTNSLLVDATKSNDFLDNIKVASDLLMLAKNCNNNDEVTQILTQFVALKPIVEQDQRGKFVCSLENMNLMGNIKKTLGEKSNKSPYKEPFANRRLNKLIINLQYKFGRYCLAQFLKQFIELNQVAIDERRAKALTRFTNLLPFEFNNVNLTPSLELLVRTVNGAHLSKLTSAGFITKVDWPIVFVDMYEDLYGQRRLSEYDPKTGKLSMTADRLNELYDNVVRKTCNYFLDKHKDLATIFENILKLVESIQLTNSMVTSQFILNDLPDYSIGYQICKDLRKVDELKVIEIISKNLAKIEE